MGESYWQRDAAWSDRQDNPRVPQSADFAVIGAGISGLSTALELRKLNPGAEIVVLEAERIGYGASGRNAGFLSPVAAPIWLLGSAYNSEEAWAAVHLNKEMHRIAQWLLRELPETEVKPSVLSIEATGRITDLGLREFASCLERIGLEHRLKPSKVRPKHRSLEINAYEIHPYKLVRGLAEKAVRAGVQICEHARVRAVEPAHPGARLRLYGGRELRSRRVIVCTNADTSALTIGERIRARSVYSFMVASVPLDESITSKMVRDGSFAVELNRIEAYHRMHRGRLLFGGADQFRAIKGEDFSVPQKVRANLASHMHASFPSTGPIEISDAWSGRLQATLNGLPIIRYSKNNPAVVVNVGYGGTGIVLGLACAPAVAALASGTDSGEAKRLLTAIQNTKPPIRGALRSVSRMAGSLFS